MIAKEKRLEYYRQYRAKNREYLREYNKRYQRKRRKKLSYPHNSLLTKEKVESKI